MTEIARRPAGALAVDPRQHDWNPDQLAALEAMGIDNTASPGDLKVFLAYAQRTQLDPFARQIHFVGRNSRENINGQWRWRKKWTIQAGIDGLIVVAGRTGEYQGFTKTEWCGEDGEWRDVWLSSEPPAAARVGVWRSGHRDAPPVVALMSEYMPTDKDGKPAGMWTKMPARMIEKCAQAKALREKFPHDLSGIYIAEEMDQAPRPAVTGPNAPTRTLSELVDASLANASADQLRGIWREAVAGGVIDEPAVDPGTGEVLGVFREHLTALLAAALEPGEVGNADGAGAGESGDPAPDQTGEVVGVVVDSDDPWSAPAKVPEP